MIGRYVARIALIGIVAQVAGQKAPPLLAYTMMEYKGFVGNIEYDDEAEIFHGEVINTRDVITFQGSSVAELRNAFRDSVDDYLEFCAQRGESSNKQRKRRFQKLR